MNGSLLTIDNDGISFGQMTGVMQRTMNFHAQWYLAAALGVFVVSLVFFAGYKVCAWWVNPIHVWHWCPRCRRHWHLDHCWQDRYWPWIGKPQKYDEVVCSQCAQQPVNANLIAASEGAVVVPQFVGNLHDSGIAHRGHEPDRGGAPVSVPALMDAAQTAGTETGAPGRQWFRETKWAEETVLTQVAIDREEGDLNGWRNLPYDLKKPVCPGR